MCRLLAALAVLACASAQQPQQPVFRAETGLVQVHASITDPAGKPLRNIPPSAVRVLENGVAQQVRFVGQENVPVSVALAIDAGADAEAVRAVSSALMAALEAGDLAYVARFDAEPGDAAAALERDGGDVQSVPLRPRTPLRDALLLMMQRMEDKGEEVKRAVVVLAYQQTYRSWHSRQDVLEAARKKGVSIYAVILQDPADPDGTGMMNRAKGALRRAFAWTVNIFDNDVRSTGEVQAELQTLTDASGGEVCPASGTNDAARCAQGFATEIRTQYVIAYRPAVLSRAERKIEITIEGHPDATVRVRKASGAQVPYRRKGQS